MGRPRAVEWRGWTVGVSPSTRAGVSALSALTGLTQGQLAAFILEELLVNHPTGAADRYIRARAGELHQPIKPVVVFKSEALEQEIADRFVVYCAHLGASQGHIFGWLIDFVLGHLPPPPGGGRRRRSVSMRALGDIICEASGSGIPPQVLLGGNRRRAARADHRRRPAPVHLDRCHPWSRTVRTSSRP